MLIAGAWSLALPLNKQLWTSSFVLWTGGFGMLAIALAQASEDGWDRSLFELFPEFRHSADLADAEYDDDPDAEPTILQRSTKELLYRLRKQVPSTRAAKTSRRSVGTNIFS